MGPDGKLQIPENALGLGEQVLPPSYARAKAAGSAAIAPTYSKDEPAQQNPSRSERNITPLPAVPRLTEGAGHERPVVEQNDERCAHHDLFGGHPRQAGDKRQNLPPQRPGRLHPADRGIQCQQIEQPHERLGSLLNENDRLGLQRVQRPPKCGRERYRKGLVAETRPKNRLPQGAPDDSEQRQRSAKVNGEISRVITANIESTEGVVDRE